MDARALLAALTMGLMASPANAADKALDRTFEVEAGGRLTVQLDAGHITVKGSDSNRVVVRLRAEGSEREIEDLMWTADRSGDGVAITLKLEHDKGWFNWKQNSMRINASVEVPRNYNVELATSGGGIDVRDLHGEAKGRTSGGRIHVESVHGKVNMRTSGGSVILKSLQGGPVHANTSGGPIQAHQIEGGLTAHTSGGSIRVEQASGPIDVHTSGGSITIDLVGENQGVVARTSGGSIDLRVPSTINAALNASTSGGRVKTDLAMTQSDRRDNSLRGTINAGGPEILARSSGGSITIAAR